MSSDVSLFESDEENLNTARTDKKILSSDYADEGDIIAETPQKVVKRKNVKRLPKCNKTGNLIITNTKIENPMKERAQHLSREFSVTRNYEFVNKSNWESENLNGRYKNPYIFFEIEEILRFTEFSQPLNLNIKTVGVYEQKHDNTHYLMEHSQNSTKILPKKISLELRLLSSFPLVNQAVEMYGFIKYCQKKTTHFPVFIANFWTNIGSDFNRYLECLRRQKHYVPNCYKKMLTSGFNELSQLELNKSVDRYFEEIDESCLNKNVEHVEQLCHEIDKMMNINISGDVFK